MTAMDEFARDVRGWARQTIIFTIPYEPADATTDAEEHARLAKTNARSAEIVDRLWADAERESGSIAQSMWKFVWLVLEWSSKNLPEWDLARESSTRGPEPRPAGRKFSLPN